jgi:hypothetical protein
VICLSVSCSSVTALCLKKPKQCIRNACREIQSSFYLYHEADEMICICTRDSTVLWIISLQLHLSLNWAQDSDRWWAVVNVVMTLWWVA